jgi:hypothetical protein
MTTDEISFGDELIVDITCIIFSMTKILLRLVFSHQELFRNFEGSI